MLPRRKRKSCPSDHDIFVEVMEPRVLLSADALGIDTSVFDRDLQSQTDWDVTIAANWWAPNGKDTVHSDIGDPTAENLHLSGLLSLNPQEPSNEGVSPAGDSIDPSSSYDDRQSLYREIVFLDAGIIDGEQLLSDLLHSTDTPTQVYLIDSSSDGVRQISSVLSSHQALDAVHIISHGTTGEVQLGSGALSSKNVESYSKQLNLWGSSLAEFGDILIYGCDLAGDFKGQSLVNMISEITSADVAASVDQTGNIEQGGDWELEYQKGNIETAGLATSITQDWTGALALVNVTTFDDIDDGGDTTDIDSLIATPGADGISLREAIIATNNDAGQADTITLSAGTYSLALSGSGEDAAATGDLDILDPLTITGAGADQTFIDAAGLDRVFQIIAGSEFNVSISDLAIQNGLVDNRGAGIHIGNLPAAPVVTLSKVLFSGNHTTGTSDYGGAIFNRGELTLVDSLIEGNSSEFGGGVMNFTGGVLKISNSTISGNSATAGDGGGLYNLSSATLLNTTVADNTASTSGGGIYNKDASGAITRIGNTLIADNTASGDLDISGSFSSNGGNLIETVGSATGLQAGDIRGSDASLSPLGNYGGITQTHALLAGSPAINPGTVTGEPASDQRGFLRDAQADIGAFEATANILIVDTLSSAADAPNATTIVNLLSNVGADGKISLSEAIMATNGTANMAGGPDEVRFEITDALIGGAHTINVAAGGLPSITEAVIIDGTTDTDYVDSPIIELNGAAAASNGINITGDGSTIRGLVINNFNSGHGIEITGDNNRIESSFIGSDAAGSAGLGNAQLGIRINSASGNYIGGAGVGNVISGNGWAGIAVVGSTSNNSFIQGNLIGTNAAGTSAIGNGNYGIDIWSGGPSNTTIGGTDASLRNVISGNLWAGIHISGASATGNQVQGNYIGTDITGTAAIGNGTGSASNGGIDIDGGANANTIGGSVGGAGNLIAYNTGPGVRVEGGTTLGNTIQENAIHSNTGIGIDLVSAGNQARQAPLMTTIKTDGAGLVAIDGSYSDPNITSQVLGIEYFSNQSNANEGRVYLDSDSFTTDGSGNASFSSGVSALVTDGEYVSATVTDSSGNTSEFSMGQVAVLAVNNAPTFLSSGPFNVDEGAVATTVVGNVDADDGDGGAADAGITYSITSNVNPDADGNNAFAIDSASGQITVNDAGDLDFEGSTPLTITVQADDGVMTSSTNVTVDLNDVAPTLTAAGTANINAGQAYQLDLTASEPGTSGITSYTVNWGDGTITTEAYTGPTTTVSHVYTNAGFTYGITFAANDVSDTWTESDLVTTNWVSGADDVLIFDGNSGDADGKLASSGGDLNQPYGIAVGPDGHFYVAGNSSNNIVSYDSDGSYLGIFSADSHLKQPAGLAWGGDGNLYVANYDDDNILRIGADGTFIDVWAVGGALNNPESIAFSPDGDLYASDWDGKKIVKIDSDLGGAATLVLDSGLSNAEQLVFDAAGNLYIANTFSNNVLRWDGTSLSTYFSHPDLDYVSGIAFGPDGQLYVTSNYNDRILRYDGVTGEVFIDDGVGGLDEPTHLAFTPDHQVTITPNNAPVASNLSSTSDYSEGDANVSITDIVLSDVDADEIITATLTVANTATGSLSANDGASYTAGTGVWTLSDSVVNVNTALSNMVFNPASNNSLDTSIDIVIDDGDEDASGALTGTIVLDVSQGGASTTVPADQNTDEDSTLVFSSGSGNAITVSDGAVGDSFLRTALSVTNGTLKLSTVAGLSFENGADETSAMTIIGLESAINTALEGLTFTPTSDYEGLANLQLMSDSQKDLQGHYTFTQPGALGADTSPAGVNAGTASGAGAAPAPSAVWDNSRGSDVLLLDGVDDNIQISGRFGAPTNLTLAAWVNVAASNNQEVISIGGSIALRLNENYGGIGVAGFFNDGSAWNHTNSSQYIGDDGWHHVAYTFDDTDNTQVIYIDGVAQKTSHYTGSINWAHESNSTIGSHAGGASYWLDGMVDDVRVYDQALNAGQIESIARGAAEVSITVDPINDAPQAINLTSSSAYIEGDASIAITDIVLSDVDAGEAISATLTLANTATGSLSANNGATYTVGTGDWTISDTVTNVNAALANVEFNPATDNDVDTTIGIDIDDGDEDASGALTGTITLDVTPENDTPVLAINTGVTVVESSTGTVIDNAQLDTSDVDNTALQLVYSITDPTDSGSLKRSGAALNISDSFTQHDIDNNRITYDHDGSETTADSFDFSVVDVEGVVSTGTFNITVTAQNDEQEITNNTGTSVNEGSAGLVLSTGMLETTDEDNIPNQLIYTLTSEPDNGTLKLNGNLLILNDTFTQDEIDQGDVTYDHGGSEAPDDSFGFSVDDGTGNASTGIFVIDVRPQNDEQIISLSTGATVDEGSIVNAIGSTQLSTTDTDHNATDLVYRVTAEAAHGVLKLGGTELSLSDSFTQDQINSGELTYDHDGSETANDSFSFSVDDGVGSASLGTFSFAIIAQNDEQQLITNSGTTINEGSSGSVISGAMLAATDVDNTALELVYKVVAIPSNGTLKLSGNALALYDTFTQDDIDNNRITYDHDGSLTISDSFGFSVDDGVGSAATGSFNIAVERESLIPQTINPVGSKISTEGIASNVQLASSVETVQSAGVPTDELEVESESKSQTDISIDEEQIDDIVTVADIQYQYTTANSTASTNAASSSPQVTLIARLLQTPAIAGLLAAPYEFDALSLEINQILTSYEFNESMDSLRKDLDDSKFLRGAVVGSSVAVTTGLSVGYVAWMVRGGVLLSSVLSSLPAWQFIDPLPVLNFSEKEEEGDEQDDSLEDIIADHAKVTDVDPVSECHEKSIIPSDSKETRQ